MELAEQQPLRSTEVRELDILKKHSNLMIKQTAKVCFQNFFCCDARTEMLMSTMERPKDILYYTEEESTCISRWCCLGCHPFVMNVSVGSEKGGPVFARCSRECACCAWMCCDCSKCMTPAHSCKCCCLQRFTMRDGKGEPIGSISERCYCCNPLFTVYDMVGAPEYDIRMPACCFGCCVNICESYGEDTKYVYCCPIRGSYVYSHNAGGGDAPLKGTSGFAKIRPMVNDQTLFENVIMGKHMYELEFPVPRQGDDHSSSVNATASTGVRGAHNDASALGARSRSRGQTSRLGDAESGASIGADSKARLLGAVLFLNEVMVKDEEHKNASTLGLGSGGPILE